MLESAPDAAQVLSDASDTNISNIISLAIDFKAQVADDVWYRVVQAGTSILSDILST